MVLSILNSTECDVHSVIQFLCAKGETAVKLIYHYLVSVYGVDIIMGKMWQRGVVNLKQEEGMCSRWRKGWTAVICEEKMCQQVLLNKNLHEQRPQVTVYYKQYRKSGCLKLHYLCAKKCWHKTSEKLVVVTVLAFLTTCWTTFWQEISTWLHSCLTEEATPEKK